MSTSVAKLYSVYGRNKRKATARKPAPKTRRVIPPLNPKPQEPSKLHQNQKLKQRITRIQAAPNRSRSQKGNDFHKFRIESKSVEPPFRGGNMLSKQKHNTSGILNTSLEEDISRLEKLTHKNRSARLGLLNVQEQMLEISINEIMHMHSDKLNTIREAEIEEGNWSLDCLREIPRPKFENPIDNLILKYESRSGKGRGEGFKFENR